MKRVYRELSCTWSIQCLAKVHADAQHQFFQLQKFCWKSSCSPCRVDEPSSTHSFQWTQDQSERLSLSISWPVWMHFLTILPQPSFSLVITCYKDVSMYVNTHTYKYTCLWKLTYTLNRPASKANRKTYKTCIDFLSSVGPIYIHSLHSCRTVFTAFYHSLIILCNISMFKLNTRQIIFVLFP